MYEISAIKCI